MAIADALPPLTVDQVYQVSTMARRASTLLRSRSPVGQGLLKGEVGMLTKTAIIHEHIFAPLLLMILLSMSLRS